jgi:nucleotidyltransferase/DNA polymerase involved in DNA repair
MVQVPGSCASTTLALIKQLLRCVACYAGELAQISIQRLQRTFGDEHGTMLHDMARGQDHDAVQPRKVPKSVGCGKTFTAHLQIKKPEKVCLTTELVPEQ